MSMLDLKALDDIATSAFNLIQLMQLGKMELGSTSATSKYMSCEQRWFRAKNSITAENDYAEDNNATMCVRQQIFLSRNSLVQLQCKRGNKKNQMITSEYFRLLGFFKLHYNKWFLPVEDKFVFTPNDTAKMTGIWFLGRLLQKRGSSYTEVKLTKNGEWGPTHVYCIKPLSDVLPMGDQGAAVLDMFTY